MIASACAFSKALHFVAVNRLSLCPPRSARSQTKTRRGLQDCRGCGRRLRSSQNFVAWPSTAKNTADRLRPGMGWTFTCSAKQGSVVPGPSPPLYLHTHSRQYVYSALRILIGKRAPNNFRTALLTKFSRRSFQPRRSVLLNNLQTSDHLVVHRHYLNGAPAWTCQRGSMAL